MNTKILKGVSALALGLLVPLSSWAFTLKSGDSVIVPQGQRVEDNLYAAGQSLTIDADIDGDLICAGQSVVINGNVKGSVICAGQSVTVNGDVEGSVRVAGSSLILNSNVKENVMAFGGTVDYARDKAIGWDMLIGAGSANILGKIGRDLHGGAGLVTLTGEVGRNIVLALGGKDGEKDAELIIAEGAKVGGNVEYTSKNDAQINQDASIGGEVTKKIPQYLREKKDAKRAGILGITALGVICLLGGIIVAMSLIVLCKKQVREITDNMLSRVGVSLGWGLIVTLLTPIVFVFLFITLVGIPLSGILLVAWLVSLYLSKIFVGILIGRLVLKKKGEEEKRSLYLAALVGIVITWIAFMIPFFGGLLLFLSVLWGMGGIWMYLKNSRSLEAVK